jgi:hypothetical protein
VLQFKEAWPAFAREPQAVGGTATHICNAITGRPACWVDSAESDLAFPRYLP